MPRKTAPTTEEIVELKFELEAHYAPWKKQMEEDDRFYNLLYDVAVSDMPDQFETVRPPSASTIIDLTADHAAGNFPQSHVPRRKETATAQEQTTIMEKAASGFWYRNIQNAPRNILRAWAQSGSLRGAVCGSLLYNPDAWPNLPLPSKFGGTESEEYKEAKDEAEALRADSWPFVLDYIDPLHVLPDPQTEGLEFVIVAFKRKVFDVLRAHPTWDRRLPGDSGPRKLTDEVEFISYHDDTYRAYIIAGGPTAKNAKALLGPVKHGYGFLPYFFMAGGFGSPFGKPEHKYAGMLTKVRDLLKVEARRMTHLDAIVALHAFPWLIMEHGVTPDMQLGGITRVPPGTDPSKAVVALRPTVPIAEIAQELQLVRSAIQRATIPDSLGAEPNKSEESGYLRSLKIGTGRARIRALSNTLERACSWATSGFYKLVENKVKAPVSVWGRGMGAEDQFLTIRPKDINKHYEVYCSLTPSLPTDESTDIANGLKLHGVGAIPVRDLLETYANRENAEELMNERLGEDVLRSTPMFGQMVQDAMLITKATGGPLGTPGFTSGVQTGLPAAPVGPTANANPASMAGVPGIPTPPPAPGSLAESENIIGRTAQGGTPTSSGPLSGIQRGPS